LTNAPAITVKQVAGVRIPSYVSVTLFRHFATGELR
jgi:hypothetical protein